MYTFHVDFSSQDDTDSRFQNNVLDELESVHTLLWVLTALTETQSDESGWCGRDSLTQSKEPSIFVTSFY